MFILKLNIVIGNWFVIKTSQLFYGRKWSGCYSPWFSRLVFSPELHFEYPVTILFAQICSSRSQEGVGPFVHLKQRWPHIKPPLDACKIAQ